MNEDCIFCKIVAGELPGDKIYENEHVTAFLDISPVNLGHALLIPKEHVKNLYEFDEKIAKEIGISMRDIAIAMKSALGADGINIGMNNDKPAGQIIDHAHIHIIPRFDNDGLKHWPSKNADEKELREVAKKIKKELNK